MDRGHGWLPGKVRSAQPAPCLVPLGPTGAAAGQATDGTSSLGEGGPLGRRTLRPPPPRLSPPPPPPPLPAARRPWPSWRGVAWHGGAARRQATH